MVNLLLNHVLVSRVIGIQDLHSLPPALSLVLVLGFKSQTGNDNSQCQALCVNTSLDQLLLTREVRVAANETECGSHGSDP